MLEKKLCQCLLPTNNDAKKVLFVIFFVKT